MTFSLASQQVSPGTRIKMLRILLNLSRDDFCKRHNLNFNTVTSIELNRLKLSSKQLSKILHAFHQEGISVEESWIRDAQGTPPSHSFCGYPSSQENILKEWMRSFLQSRHTIIATVSGKSMEPFYEEGDLVGGIWNTSPHSLIGKKCIVQVQSSLHVGILLRNREDFMLVPQNTTQSFQILPLSPTSCRVAEILWHIKRQGHLIPDTNNFVMAWNEKKRK